MADAGQQDAAPAADRLIGWTPYASMAAFDNRPIGRVDIVPCDTIQIGPRRSGRSTAARLSAKMTAEQSNQATAAALCAKSRKDRRTFCDKAFVSGTGSNTPEPLMCADTFGNTVYKQESTMKSFAFALLAVLGLAVGSAGIASAAYTDSYAPSNGGVQGGSQG